MLEQRTDVVILSCAGHVDKNLDVETAPGGGNTTRVSTSTRRTTSASTTPRVSTSKATYREGVREYASFAEALQDRCVHKALRCVL